MVFTGELSAQLADARGTTTSKLDAPVNKLARLLNSPSIKRVLLNDSLTISFDEVIENDEVLVVKGALGTMGAGNTSVLMQLLVGMLDAALARCQDAIAGESRRAVALKVDEAPLVLNRGFADTMALKRSAGLETVACWQSDSQWTDGDVRAQLDALFAHRVYFATASTSDARDSASLMMANYSDVVRPDIRNLSALGRPDVRLHLPRHTAIVSWVTSEGRQAPFVAQTLPLIVDEERLALHAATQAARGGRYREDLSQRHWDCGVEASSSSDASPSPTSGEIVIPESETASTPSESYREIVELNSAQTVRWAKPASPTTALDPEPMDIEILVLVSSMRHVLTSQLHRRFNEGRAATTTQRRLKRLSDAGLVARFQFHRPNGGGIPMCSSITPAGRQLLIERSGSTVPPNREDEASRGSEPSNHDPSFGTGDRQLRQARHDVRVAGWALAVEQALAGGVMGMRGPEESVISPSRSKVGGHSMLALADLRLPDGRTPHGFLCTLDTGERVEVERFQSIRPDATLRPNGGRELLVEFDDRLPEGSKAGKLERYDHFLAGWSTRLDRYTRPGGLELPLVVFVCRERNRARECARRADHILTACRAYAGEYPSDWDYPGRERIVFASERDAHEGLLFAWGVPRLPPDVRVAAAHGDPRARDPLIQHRAIHVRPA